MKKFFTFFFLLFAAFSASTSNYFTIVGAVNDTLRINPTYLDGYVIVTFGAHFDGYVDNWRLELTYPKDTVMEIINVQRRSDMDIPYLQSDGTEAIYHAELTVSPKFFNYTYNGEIIISSTINEYGYWDYNHDGIYEPYGTIKWGAGDYYDFFRIDYHLIADCTGDSIVIDGRLTSTYDSRGYYIAMADFYKVIYLRVAYLFGDVNGDEVVNIADVTALMNYVLAGGDWFDQYQFEAADINGDGVITVGDVSGLIALVLANGTASIEDINDILSNSYDM